MKRTSMERRRQITTVDTKRENGRAGTEMEELGTKTEEAERHADARACEHSVSCVWRGRGGGEHVRRRGIVHTRVAS